MGIDAETLKQKVKDKTNTSEKISYRKGGSFISLEEAQKLGWAKLSDGSPTAKYLKILKARKERKEKGSKTRKPRKTTTSLDYVYGEHAGIESPYNLNRRSGYKTIWQVLAENADQVVPWKELHEEVNKRLAEEPKSADWYEKNYASQKDETGAIKTYDVNYNAHVINRHPYNARIEALGQRVICTEEGVMLKTNVTEPRKNSRIKQIT